MDVSKQSKKNRKTLRHKTHTTVQTFHTVFICFHVHYLNMLSSLFTLCCIIPCNRWHSNAAKLRFKIFCLKISQKVLICDALILHTLFFFFFTSAVTPVSGLFQTETSSFHETKGFSSLVYRGNQPVRWKVWFKELRWCSSGCIVGTWVCMTGKWGVRKLVVLFASMFFLLGELCLSSHWTVSLISLA